MDAARVNDVAKIQDAWKQAIETGFAAEAERSDATIPAHRDFIAGVVKLEELNERCDAAWKRYKERCRAAWVRYDDKAMVLRDEGEARMKAELWASDRREAAQVKSLESLRIAVEASTS